MKMNSNSRKIFLAPRSNEHSYDNFKSTIEHGIDYDLIQPHLDEQGKDILSKEAKIFAWGSRDSLRSRWDKMEIGDYVLFYSKGTFVMGGKLLYKQYSEGISDALWPRQEKYQNQAWSCIYFVHDLVPINIPLDEINEIAGYKKNFVLQGFQALNDKGIETIISKYGSVTNFVEGSNSGVGTINIARLNHIASKDDTNSADLEELDRVVGESEIEDVISELYARNTSLGKERIVQKVEKIKRDYLSVRKLKDIYNDRCQVCNFTIDKPSGKRYSEVAHIKALKDDGEDNIGNMLVLCPNHHKMLDHGSMSVDLSTKEVIIDGQREKLFDKHLK
jgi:hypothetical protein